MKKLLSILTIVSAALMLSSCLVIAPDDFPELIIHDNNATVVTQSQPSTTTTVQTQETVQTSRKYSITCRNDTSLIITDWCVKKDNVKTYANSTDSCFIRPGRSDSIRNLPEGYYRIYFTFEDDYQLNPGDYYSSENIYLDQDITYCLYERANVISYRSADGTEVTRKQLYLAGSDGSEIDLVN